VSTLGVVFMVLLGAHVAHALCANRETAPATSQPHTLTALVMLVQPYVVVCCSGAKRVRVSARIAALAQTVLFLFACYYGVRQGVFSRRLISPAGIGMGLVIGHLIFGVSLLVTHRSLRDTAIHFVDMGSIWEFVVENPRILSRFLIVGITEETIYRVGAQGLLVAWTGSAALGILVVAAVFSLVHEHFFKNPKAQSAEFVGFAILLGVLYYWTASLILVIVVHALRNIEIAFLEYLVRVEELGGEEQACRESDMLAGSRVVVFVTPAAQEGEVACLEYCREPRWAGNSPRRDAPSAHAPICRDTGNP